jgi:glycerol-3-phosphate cytidylyltransferase
MKYCFDLDETICLTPSDRQYKHSIPYVPVVDRINRLYDEGHEITIFTARGSSSGIDYSDLNKEQLARWGVKYHKLIDKGKPSYDLFVDDRAISASQWRKQEGIILVGFVASCFDLLHAGHCLYLKEAKSVCDYLIAALQEDPSADRPQKNKPIQTIEERKIQLESVKYVDEVVVYKTEKDLEMLLEKIRPNVRILGSDAKGKPITGHTYCTNIYYHERSHDWSSSDLRNRCK